MLLEFVRDQDVLCPRCDYNLRNLTQPVCPECREQLSLIVGVQRVRVHWLLLTLAPGLFCAIGVGLFLAMCLIHGSPGRMPAEAILTLAFMVFSGVIAVVLAVKYPAFLQMSADAQVGWTLATWGIHLLVFIMVASTA